MNEVSKQPTSEIAPEGAPAPDCTTAQACPAAPAPSVAPACPAGVPVDPAPAPWPAPDPAPAMRAVRGLGIAITVVSALAVLSLVASILAACFGADVLAGIDLGLVDDIMSSDAVTDELAEELTDEAFAYIQDLDATVVLKLGGAVIGGAVGVLALGLLMAAVGLIAGILCIVQGSRPDRAGMLFGWTLAGAICSLLGGHIVSMVLLIIACVFAGKARSAYRQARAQRGVAR